MPLSIPRNKIGNATPGATRAKADPVRRSLFPIAPSSSSRRLLGIVALIAGSVFLLHAAPPRAAQSVATSPSPTSTPGHFADVSEAMGVHFVHKAPHTTRKYLLETMGSGAALFDCDNDGRLDLLLINGAPINDPTPKGTIPRKSGPADWNRLFHQTQNGKFEDITDKANLQGIGYGMGVAVGDYDNDGNEDVFVTEFGGNRLYHNNGNCRFTDVTEKAGLTGSGWSTSAAWIDLDNDGLLDLVVLRYVVWDWDDIWCGHPDNRAFCHPDQFQPIPMLVYHNDGDGRFTEEAAKIGLAKPAKALGVAIADYDRDGNPDIYVANDSMAEFLFHHKKDGKFEEVGLESGVSVDNDGQVFAGMGVDFADYDNDGFPDLIVTDLANQKYSLYRNDHDGAFDYSTDRTGIGAMTMLHSGWGVRFLDYDNDGWKDLLIAQGHDLDTVQKSYPLLRYREPMLLVRNTGTGFIDVSAQSGEIFHQAWAARGMAIGDIDNDGRVDAVVTTNDGPAHILHNETPSRNHWLTLKLVGHKSNRDGIGASIEVTTAQATQWVTVSSAGSYLSSSDLRAHFGLGASSTARLIEIHWPSGIIQQLPDVAGDRLLQVDEPAEHRGTEK